MNGGVHNQNMIFKDKKILVLTIRSSMDFEKNTVEPLKKIFNTCVAYSYRDKYEELGRRLMNRDLMELFGKEKPDLVFFLAAGEEIYKSTIMKMTNTSSITLGWFFDDTKDFDTYSKWWTDVLSYYVTHDRKSYIKCKNRKINAILIPIFTNPRYYRPHPCSKKYDVSFVGAGYYPSRKIFFQSLAKIGIKVSKYGRGWENESLSVEDVVKMYNETKINISLSGAYVPDFIPGAKKDIKQLKGKLVEIAMCGGFILTDYTPYLEDYFNIGKEVICFSDVENAKRKIEYYLSHNQEREQIAQAGYEKARRHYSSDVVLRNFFKEVSQLESQKMLTGKKNNKNIGRFSWSAESYVEKVGKRRMVANRHLYWGLTFFRKYRFFLAIDELIQAFLQSPLFVFRFPCRWVSRRLRQVWRAVVP